MKNLIFLLILGFLLVAMANADIVPPATITATSDTELYTPAAMNAVNGAGLDAIGPDGGHNAGTWQSFNCGSVTLDTDVILDIDLGAVYGLSDVYVWNYNGNAPDWPDEADTGWWDMRIEYSLDGINWGYVSDNIIPVNWPGDPEYGVWPFHKQATIDLGWLGARYLRLTNTENWAYHNDTGGNVNFRILSEVEFEIADAASSGIVLEPTDGTTEVTEGGAGDSVGVYLTQAPAGAVEIEVFEQGLCTPPTEDPNDPNIIISTCAYDLELDGQAGGEPVVLTFDSANWATPQYVDVQAIDDSDGESTQLGFLIARAVDPNLVDPNRPAGTMVTIYDNELPSVLVSKGQVYVREIGVTDTYEIELTLPPTSQVTVTIGDTADPDQIAADPVVFNTGETGPKVATIAAVDDDVAEANPHQATITHTVSQPGGSGEYDGLSVPDVVAEISENDCGPENGNFNYYDVNGDCVVNLADLAPIAAVWLEWSIDVE